MLSGNIGFSSPGQLSAGAIGIESSAQGLLPAPFNRTFFVPQNGLPWDGYKAPQSLVNFSFDWSDEIGDDLILQSAWSVESSDIAIATSAIDPSQMISTVLISGGVSANIYNVTNEITTQSGLQLTATFRLFLNAYNW